MTDIRHNLNAVRLAGLAGDAQIALDKVARGEADAVAGWLAYGAALNEGRALFSGDREFGEWLRSSNLEEDIHPADQAAAMWAAANADQFEEARAAGNARTVRGIHAKWRRIEAERRNAKEEAERKLREEQAEAARKAAAEAQANEQAARAAAAAAESEADREAAEARAAEAAAAKAEAEAQAQAATAEPEAEDDDPAELAADPFGYAKLTHEALVETANGLRADLDDEKVRRKAAETERDDYKAKWREATAEDMGRALGNAQRARDTAKFRLGEEQAKNARQQRRIDKQDAEIKKLRERLEQQVVTL